MFYLYAVPCIPDGTVVSFLDGQWIPWEDHIKSLIDAT